MFFSSDFLTFNSGHYNFEIHKIKTFFNFQGFIGTVQCHTKGQTLTLKQYFLNLNFVLFE